MRNYAKFIASLLLFGSNGVVAAQIELSSGRIVLCRTFIGAAFLGLVLLARAVRGGRPRPAAGGVRSWLFVVASGVSMGLSWLFLYEAYREVGVSVSSLAYYCAPIIVMALSPVLFKEPLTARGVASLAVVFAGAVLMNGATLATGGSSWGMLCGWLSAAAHAAMVVFSKLGDDVDGLDSSCAQLAASCAVAFVSLAATSGLPFCIPASSAPWVVVLGVVNTGVGCYWYFSSFQGLTAQTVSVLGYLEPLSAVVCAAVFLGESLGAAQLLGGALIIGGALAGTAATAPRTRG